MGGSVVLFVVFIPAGAIGSAYLKKYNIKSLYSESQINEYIARAHTMSSSKFILKSMTAVMLSPWSAQKESF